jgi:hypothetical protein
MQPDHTEGRIAHEVHAQLVGRSQLGAHDEPEAADAACSFDESELAGRRTASGISPIKLMRL